MKKMKLTYVIFALLAITFASCEKKYENIGNDFTYYPTFVMEGDAEMIIQKGDAFVDPGITATEDGKELEITTVVSSLFGESSLNSSMVDIYTITYLATNSDGYNGSASRTVIVANQGDLVNSIEGIYLANTGRSSESFTGLKWIVISEREAGKFYVADAIGGYYYLGRRYGFPYAFQGGIVTGSGGSFTQEHNACAPGWGCAYTAEMTDFSTDPGARTIGWTGTASFGSVFTVLLTQDPKFD